MVDNMAFHFPENVSFCRRNDFFMRMEYEKITYCIFSNWLMDGKIAINVSEKMTVQSRFVLQYGKIIRNFAPSKTIVQF